MEYRGPDYDEIASTYDCRYAANRLDGIGRALIEVSRRVSARMILEVGCGTGRWIEELRATGATVIGIDPSTGMLAGAAAKLGHHLLIAAEANRLPFTGERFDMIFCVKALHHFDDPKAFIARAPALLKQNGILAIVGIDPRATVHRYHHDFFAGTRQSELRRYPSFGQIVDWMYEAGLEEVELRVVDKSRRQFVGEEVLRDPFLQKHADSTLALLSDEAYAAGLRRIHEVARTQKVFRSEMDFCMITGRAILEIP